jgi:hypothetical protein
MRSVLLCGYTSTEAGPGDFSAPSVAGVVWELIHYAPEILIAYDRIYLWDWQFEWAVEKLHPGRIYEDAVFSEMIDLGIIRSLDWPLLDQEESLALQSFAFVVGDAVADELDYPLFDDGFIIPGMVADLELSARSKVCPMFLREIQFDWACRIANRFSQRELLRQLLEQYVQRAKFEVCDDEEIQEMIQGEITALLAHKERFINRRPKRRASRGSWIQAIFRAFVPDLQMVSYDKQYEYGVPLDLILEWRDAYPNFLREIDKLAKQCEDRLFSHEPKNEEQRKLAELVINHEASIVEEIILEYFPTVKGFHRILTHPYLGIITDALIAVISLALGVPINPPGISAVPSVLGKGIKRNAIARGRGHIPQDKLGSVDWYFEWLDWKHSYKLDGKTKLYTWRS